MKFITVKQMAEKLGMSESSVWRKGKSDKGFPQLVRTSDGMTRGLEEECEEYAQRIVRESRINPTKRASASIAAAKSVKVRAKKREVTEAAKALP